ncbi:ataxin-7-like protein 2b isoform X2 [Scophthalmus maximus]|uniref:ataxin-7-like protein 2b isoform X2 n=1 Tax=Scophthalmus maximus TaxID=52904 RepID=UPI0015E0AC67|nr:ataxin-7-like protein 2b isoform X2 [Scophthalmus maximus]
MAALSRRWPSLDDFVGLSWSRWADVVDVLPPDGESRAPAPGVVSVTSVSAASKVEDSSKCARDRCETMTLRKEDMHILGHCPAHDDFYLVVCGHCGQVVKPGAFEKHCARRHGPLTKMCGQSSTLASQQRPRPGQPPSNLSSFRDGRREGRHREDRAPSSAALPVQHHRPSKAQREAVSLPPVAKFPQENAPLQPHPLPMPRPRVPPLHSGPLPPGLCSSSTPPPERPPVQKSTAGQSSESHSPLRATRTYSRIYKNIDKKECDLNKNCRNLGPERKKPGSPMLICNTDSIHQQPKALGRARTFDQLAGEQRVAPAGRDVEQVHVKLKDKEQHLESCEEKLTQGSRCNCNSNCHMLGSGDPQEEGDSTAEVEVQPPYPFNQSLLSSKESEDDEQEEGAELPASAWHPKPLGLCTFGCRALGCSIFAFDRRLHHLRFALSTMLERHVNTHLWKKMPQVSSALRTCHVTPPTLRTAARPLQSTGSLSLESTSLGQLETKSSQHNSQSTKPPSSTSSAPLGPGRWRSPVGRSSKAQLKEAVLMQDASAAQKATTLPHRSEDKSSRRIMDPTLHEKGQPRNPPCPGEASGTLSHEKNSCPPLPLQPSERHLSGLEKRSPLPAADRSPRNRGRGPAIQQKVMGYDHKGCGQKRKGNTESPPLTSALSRTSKCKRLSSPSNSSLFTWK